LHLVQGALDHGPNIIGSELFKHQHAAAGEKGAVEGEARVFGGSADEGEEAALDVREQRVLLLLVEAVDLVEKQHRPFAGDAAVRRRCLDHLLDLCHPDAGHRKCQVISPPPPLVAQRGGVGIERATHTNLPQSLPQPRNNENALVGPHRAVRGFRGGNPNLYIEPPKF